MTAKRSMRLAVVLAILVLGWLPAWRLGAEAPRGIERVSFSDPAGHRVGFYAASYALVIGISDYSAGWPDLPGAAADVEAVSEVLEEHGFEVRREFDLDQRNLERVIREFIADRGQEPDARLVIYFAGHGHTLEQSFGGVMGYVVPSDAPRPDRNLNGFLKRALPMDQVEVYAKTIQSKHALFVFDSCFSGSIFPPRGAIPEHINAKTALPVRQFITAGSADETVSDASVFRTQVVAALRGDGDTNGDGYVTGTELGEFLFEKVVDYSRGTQHPQHGKIRHQGLDRGDFVFRLPDAGGAVPPPSDTPRPGQAWTVPVLGIRFRYVPAGEFRMGSPAAERGRGRDERLHAVTLTRGFWMGETEVTQEQFARFIAATGYVTDAELEGSSFDWAADQGVEKQGLSWWQSGGGEHPVVHVSWKDAQAFCAWASHATGRRIRLPTEAEWERAARAGTETATYAGDLSLGGKCRAPELEEIAWYCGNSDGSSHPVGGKRANAWNLHDMLGNVWEWVEDAAERGVTTDTYGGDMTDPLSTQGARRIYRGGCWGCAAHHCRAADRAAPEPGFRFRVVGFRVAVTAD